MPKLYEYLGIVIFFYSNEHEPIHVHARYGESESKIELTLENGVITKIHLMTVSGKKPLPAAQARRFKELVSILGDEIVQSWINYFVYNKKIVTKKIQGSLK